MANGGVAMKRTYRISFDENIYADVIRVIECCPKFYRSELIAYAIRELEKQKNNVLLPTNGNMDLPPQQNAVSQEKQNEPVNNSTIKTEKQTASDKTQVIDISDVFKF